MDKLANKVAYGSPEWKRARSGARQGLVGLGLIVLVFPLWKARDFIPTLAATRVVATASLWAPHDGGEAQLQRAFAAAKTSSRAEVTFEPGAKPDRHGVTYYLSVTADTPERAKADLTTLTDGIRAAFPSAERDLIVSPNKSTVPAPNELSRRISFGVQAAVVLMVLGAQLLMVIGAHREGMDRAGLFAAVATPFTIFLFPGDSNRRRSSNAGLHTDWQFVLLLLAFTPVSVVLALWLTRRSGPDSGRRRRA
jgi:hypothetical protein